MEDFPTKNHQTLLSTLCLQSVNIRQKRSAVAAFIGKAAADNSSRDKHLISGVNFRLSFFRNRHEFCLIYDDESKDYKIEISQAKLYMPKMTVPEKVFSEIKSTLKKSPAIYRYTEIIRKFFYSFGRFKMLVS